MSSALTNAWHHSCCNVFCCNVVCALLHTEMSCTEKELHVPPSSAGNLDTPSLLMDPLCEVLRADISLPEAQFNPSLNKRRNHRLPVYTHKITSQAPSPEITYVKLVCVTSQRETQAQGRTNHARVHACYSPCRASHRSRCFRRCAATKAAVLRSEPEQTSSCTECLRTESIPSWRG